MENRVDFQNGSFHSEEVQTVEDGVSAEERAEEMIEPASASSEPKDFEEEDEVFEEAVGTKEQLPQHESVEADHDLSSMAAQENLNAADAVEDEKSDELFDLDMKPLANDTGEHKGAGGGEVDKDEDLGGGLHTEKSEVANLSAEEGTTSTDDVIPSSAGDIDVSDETETGVKDNGHPPEEGTTSTDDVILSSTGDIDVVGDKTETGVNGNGHPPEDILGKDSGEEYTDGVLSEEPEKNHGDFHEEQTTDVEKDGAAKSAAVDGSSSLGNGIPISVEKDVDARNEKVWAPESESQLNGEKGFLPSGISGKANEVHTNGDVTRELEKKENISEEDQKSQLTELEVQPGSDVASSSFDTVSAPIREKNLEATVEKVHTANSNLRVDDNSDSQPEATGGNVNEAYTNGGAAKELEKKEEKFQPELKPKVKKELGGVQPPADVRSASETSTNHAPLPARPAGLGRAAPLLEPAPRAAQQPRPNGTVSQLQAQQIEDTNGEGEETDETRDKLQMIRVKFLRLAHRLGQTPHNVVVAQVLYRLGLAEQLRGRNGGRVGAFSFDRASAMAEQLEASGQEPLDFSCTIMVLGKTGVGKSATINSIFDEPKFSTDAFHMGTRKVQDVVGTVQGIKVRVIDTPGLLPSWSDQRHNLKILQSVKQFIKKSPPDIVLYLDRLDMQSRDFGDMPLLRTITETFGPSIWFNAIVVLTHAASAPPEGPNGTVSSYDMFVTQRSHVVQQAIRQAAGDMRLMNPVSLVENHSACRTNRAGQRVLPNGQVWKPHLLLLSFASKILAEANVLLKLQDSPPGNAFPTRSRAPPLPFLLSSLLQSRPQLKLPEEQTGDEDGADEDLDDSSDSDDDTEYDDLPPFKSLSKAQLAKLTKAQRKAYFDELEYREKLFMKKQLKEERKRRKMMKKMAAAAAREQPSEFVENTEEESGSAASVPVPMPDLALPASFDSDNPTHRYRYLDTSNPWLVRPVLETHGWDHDVGYEGINVERLFVVKEKVPVSFSGQVTKDKKDSNIQMEVASSIKHGEGKATSLGFDLQTVGKDMSYTLRSETKFCDYKKNKATAGLSMTLLGDALSAGVKLEDRLIVNKRFQMVMTGGAMSSRGDIAYGGSLEAQLRDKDYPLGRSLSTLGLSVMDWHGDLAIGCNLQSQIPVGRTTNLVARANLNNRGAGQVSIRLNSSEQMQLVLVGLIPLVRKLFGVSQQQ